MRLSMLLSLLLVSSAARAQTVCEIINGQFFNGTETIVTQLVMCPSSYAAGPGSCSAGQYVSGLNASGVAPTCSALPAAPAQTITTSTPTRTLNSTFTPSTTKAVFVSYSVSISCTASLAGGQNGSIELRSDSASPPTTIRAVSANANSVALAIALTVVNAQTTVLSMLVQPNDTVRLVSTGSCTNSIVAQTEVALN